MKSNSCAILNWLSVHPVAEFEIYTSKLIYDVDDRKSVVGDLDLCKLCGENLHKAAGKDKADLGAGEQIVRL